MTRVREIGRWAAPVMVMAALLFGVGWLVSGGRWMIVETPSMGTQAPVGSLLWVSHAEISTLQAGDFITFRPPGQSANFSHLVRTAGAEGVTTGGLISGDDPWTVHQGNLLGRVVATWFGVGWLIKAAPILVIGTGLVAAVRRFVPRYWKVPATILGVALVLAVAVVVVRPLTRAEQLSFTPRAEGGAQTSWVTTGVLPMRLHTTDGRVGTVMRPGEVGRIEIPQPDLDGRYRAHVNPAIPWWFWVTVMAFCFFPAAWVTIRGDELEGADADADSADGVPADADADSDGVSLPSAVHEGRVLPEVGLEDAAPERVLEADDDVPPVGGHIEESEVGDAGGVPRVADLRR